MTALGGAHNPGSRAAILAVAVIGLITTSPDHAVATHVSCGDTITRDTRLDSDLIDCPGDGVVIGAGNITLDLNGHTIDGDGTSPDFDDFGVDNSSGRDGVQIRDGQVRQFTDGLELIDTAGNSVLDLTVSRNELDGIFLTTADDNRIEGNRVFRNDFRGIVVRDSRGNRIEDNSLFGNDHAGVAVFRSTQTRIERNSVAGSRRSRPGRAEFGIELVDSSANQIKDNVTVQHSEAGIVLFGGSGNEIEENSVSTSSVFAGIDVLDSDNNLIMENLVFNNDAVGILIESEFPNDAVVPDGNVVLENGVHGNSEDGILVTGRSKRTLVERNLASRNGDDGIDVDAPRTRLADNTANGNRDLGIEAVRGVIDGGGNKAKGNGNPAQCRNVRCNVGGGDD